MRAILPLLSRLFGRRDEGQMIVMAALSLTVVIAFSALAIDVGNFLHTRTKLQADVDALALAGAQVLDGTAAKEAVARAIAESMKAPNNLLATDNVVIRFNLDCDNNATPNHDRITVLATRRNDSFLAQVVGFEGADITACATAGRFAFGGSNGIRPFALEDNCITELDYNETVVIKYDSRSVSQTCDSDNGNFAAVAIDGTGASVYRTTIKYGSDGKVCTDNTPGGCPTLNAGCVGVYQIDTEPGNMTGPTRDGIDFLIGNTPPNCDTWEEVTTASGDIEPACEPWSDSYTATGTRIIIIPVVNGLWDSGGRHTVTIKSFAVVFLEGYGGKCSGNSCDVEARFIKMVGTLPNAERAPVGPLTNITMVALIK